jgi:hypothetical protein
MSAGLSESEKRELREMNANLNAWAAENMDRIARQNHCAHEWGAWSKPFARLRAGRVGKVRIRHCKLCGKRGSEVL